MFAGRSRNVADFGADVIKVEHPRGDPLRNLAWQKDGVSLWWAYLNRNKRYISLNLSKPQGASLLSELVRDADVLVESFRPGRMETWGIGYEQLRSVNPGLIMVRTTGLANRPYKDQAGWTVAEAMSGYAYTHGFPTARPACRRSRSATA